LKITLFKDKYNFKEFSFNNKFINNMYESIDNDSLYTYHIILDQDDENKIELNNIYTYILENGNNFSNIYILKGTKKIEMNEQELNSYSIRVNFDNEYNKFNIIIRYKRS